MKGPDRGVKPLSSQSTPQQGGAPNMAEPCLFPMGTPISMKSLWTPPEGCNQKLGRAGGCRVQTTWSPPPTTTAQSCASATTQETWCYRRKVNKPGPSPPCTHGETEDQPRKVRLKVRALAGLAAGTVPAHLP